MPNDATPNIHGPYQHRELARCVASSGWFKHIKPHSNERFLPSKRFGLLEPHPVHLNQCKTLPHLPHTSSIGNSLITLSPNDGELLCGGPAHQIASRSHLMAKCNQSVYKIVYDAAELSSIYLEGAGWQWLGPHSLWLASCPFTHQS